MPNFDLALRGRVVFPDLILDDGWVGISGGKIVALGSGDAPETAETYDPARFTILPGVIDGQTHAGSFGGLDGIRAASRGALSGGVTTMVDMPYDSPKALTTLEDLQLKRAKIDELAHCDFALYGTVAKGQGPAAVAELVAAGIVAFKISSFENDPIRFPRIPADEMMQLLEATAALDIPVGLPQRGPGNRAGSHCPSQGRRQDDPRVVLGQPPGRRRDGRLRPVLRTRAGNRCPRPHRAFLR